MPYSSKYFITSLIVFDLVEVLSFSFDAIVYPASFFDHIHEDLVGDDSCEGLVLWCSCCCHYEKTIGSGLGQVNPYRISMM